MESQDKGRRLRHSAQVFEFGANSVMAVSIQAGCLFSESVLLLGVPQAELLKIYTSILSWFWRLEGQGQVTPCTLPGWRLLKPLSLICRWPAPTPSCLFTWPFLCAPPGPLSVPKCPLLIRTPKMEVGP